MAEVLLSPHQRWMDRLFPNGIPAETSATWSRCAMPLAIAPRPLYQVIGTKGAPAAPDALRRASSAPPS